MRGSAYIEVDWGGVLSIPKMKGSVEIRKKEEGSKKAKLPIQNIHNNLILEKIVAKFHPIIFQLS